jgi:hypothetical protein
MKIFKIVVINLIVVFVLLEGGMRLYYSFADQPPPHSDHSVVREWRWVKNMLKTGKVHFDPRFVHDPYAGWRNAPNIDRVVEHHGSIRTNSHGMRNDRDFAFEPTPGRPRLMIVGDSYSFGHGVSNEQTYAYQLASMLPDWDVMNLAVSATGTDQNYIMYEQYGEKFSPNVVLLGFYLLDFNRNTFSFRDYAKPMYVPQEDGTLKLTHSPVPSPEQLLNDYKSGKKQIGGWHYSYAVAAFQKVLTTHTKRDRSEGSLPRRTLTGIMEKFNQRVRANGATPVWLIFPIRDIINEEESKYEVIAEFAEAEARRLGMPVLNMDPVFRRYLQDHPEVRTLWRPREIGGHLSELGNRVTAESVLALLKDLKLEGDQEAVVPGLSEKM